jgi:arsenite methyltransferase
MSQKKMKDIVREGYSEIARSQSSCCCGSKKKADGIASSIGYSAAELAALPEGANLGLSCGNPAAVASLKEGETVVDLGSGAGFDAFICAPKVGATGKVIGVDMTWEMLEKARKNAEDYSSRSGFANVEFRLGEIEHLPLADDEADVVISNCVINLSPEKQQVWNEIGRVLKPGGRVSVSDIALLKPLPEATMKTVRAIVGCVGGAVHVDDTLQMAEKAGLENIEFSIKDGYVNAMEEWKDPLYGELRNQIPEGETLGDYIASCIFTARKPG